MASSEICETVMRDEELRAHFRFRTPQEVIRNDTETCAIIFSFFTQNNLKKNSQKIMNKKCEIVAGKETFFAIQFSMFDPRVPSERYRMREAYPPPRTSEKYLLTQ